MKMFFGSDDSSDGEDEEGMGEERREDIEDILEKYDERFEEAGIEPTGRVESREYQQYKEAEEQHRKKTWYEKLVNRLSLFEFNFSDMEQEHRQALALLYYDIKPSQIAPTALILTVLSSLLILPVFLSPLPAIFKIMALSIPPAVFYYIVKYPSLKAKRRVVDSSEDLILAVLYMVIHMRSSPALEGSVSFAARHLDGPVSRDLKLLLWRVDMRQYNSIREGLEDYMSRWRPYNKGFVQALNLIMSSTEEANEEKRNEILTEAVENLLDFTRGQMNDFAKDLQAPVMVLYGIGILLPVLGVILFPLVATFMGGGGMVYYLFFLYNILIPLIVFILMRNLLLDRPLSLSSETGRLEDINPGSVGIEMGDKRYNVNAAFLAVPLSILLMLWPAPHLYNIVFGQASFPIDPGLTTLFREMMPIIAVSLPLGFYLIGGYREIVEKQVNVRRMEEEFPEALFELGNALERGQPIEIAVSEVGRSHENLTISKFFTEVSSNIRDYSMTFKQAVFDSEQGAIQMYPSKMIRTVMEVISESTQKGTKVAAKSMQSISNYLKNIQQTQETLEDAVDDTLSSLKFLAFVLAPVIAGVAVGMGSVISISLYSIGQVTNQTAVNQSAQGPGGGLGGGGATGLSGILDISSVIPPGLLQMIIGFYLIEISFLVGTLLVRVKEGKNEAKRNTTIGKILISSTVIYVITVVILVVVFGGILRGAMPQ
ncbi:MAG: hypothetical protein SVQ76_01270 [Candidatus Nanohaloarchaea archaeon]|nr:hypothetical protein [Candidatus Nanohaloarchaea archaeon]